jgi:peptidyl-prolyl cis-trans isomerase SurA
VLLQDALAGQREVRLSEIAIPIFERGEDGTRALLQQIFTALEGGADFATLAREYSRTPSASNGGDTGWSTIDALPEALQETVSRLQPGQVSPPTPITNGVSVLLITDERRRAGESATRVRLSYAEALFDSEDAARTARAGFAQCTIPNPNSGALNRTPPIPFPDAPSAYQDVLAEIPVGQVSRPIARGERFALIQLCARTVDAPIEQRNAVADALFADRVTGYAEGYLQTLRRESLIERRE